MTIEELLNSPSVSVERKITALKEKSICVPPWYGGKGLVQEFDPKNHAVMNKTKYPDIVDEDGVHEVTRITVDLQRLAVKRLTELMTGIPIKRVYKPSNDKQNEIARFMEAVYIRNRIDSFNIERLNMLFAGCEVMTLWYAIEEANEQYGFKSRLRFRCKNYSPMTGDELYPLYDEYGDMKAMSVGYSRMTHGKKVGDFDVYTTSRHVKFSNPGDGWVEVENEDISKIGKIPAVYVYRPTPIWEDSTRIVSEIEWSLSRNGNYLRENSKPLFALFTDEIIEYGDEKSPNKEFRGVLQFPKGSTAQYITWTQATESLKYQVDTLRSLFFTQLQLPDWNYEKMSQQAMSGESRKQMFIDAQLKVKDESGRILEMLDRETNVLRAFLKLALPETYSSDIDRMLVEHVITPFMIDDDKETIENLLLANGNKPLMSQRESIETYGKSEDVEQTMLEIADEKKEDALGSAL